MGAFKLTLLAAAASGFIIAGAHAQQGEQQESALNEQEIREFFKSTETTLQEATQGGEFDRIAEFLRQRLAEDAAIWANEDVYLKDKRVASSLVTIDKDTAENLVGFVEGAMSGRTSIEDYDLKIDVKEIEMSPGERSAKVTTEITESGVFQLKPAQNRQAVRSDQDETRSNQDDATGATDTDSTGASDTNSPKFESTANCTHQVHANEDGELMLGDTVCRTTTRVE